MEISHFPFHRLDLYCPSLLPGYLSLPRSFQLLISLEKNMNRWRWGCRSWLFPGAKGERGRSLRWKQTWTGAPATFKTLCGALALMFEQFTSKFKRSSNKTSAPLQQTQTCRQHREETWRLQSSPAARWSSGQRWCLTAGKSWVQDPVWTFSGFWFRIDVQLGSFSFTPVFHRFSLCEGADYFLTSIRDGWQLECGWFPSWIISTHS